jgi:hypothetical protein
VVIGKLGWYRYDGGISAFLSGARSERGLGLEEADGKPDTHDATSELEGARLRVIVAFAYWFWCQRRLRDLVNSFHSFDTSSAWLASFSQQRRAARNAEVRWVAAIYDFKCLVEAKAEDLGRWEH